MVRHSLLWMTSALCVLVSLCMASPSHAADAPTCQPDKLATRYPSLVGKTIHVGQDGVSMPYSFHDPENPDHIIGADTDYARAVFACIGVPVTIDIGSWGGLLPAVAAGRLDVMWDNLYYTPERAQRVDFVLYSLASDTAILRKGNPKKIESLSDLCGVRALAGLGTVEAVLLNNLNQKCTDGGKPAIEAGTYQDRSTAWPMLENDRTDIVLSSTAMGHAAVDARPNTLQSGFDFLPDIKVGAAVAKGQPELAQAISDAMQATLATGAIAKMYASYKIDPKLLLPPQILTK